MQTTIEAVLADKRAFGEAVQPPANAYTIASMIAAARENFAAIVPDDFAVFLAITNGLQYNGALLYGADQTSANRGPGQFWAGLIEANTMWRNETGHTEYLVLGETDMDLLTVDLEGKNPLLRAQVGGNIYETFDTISAAIDSILRSRLEG